PTAISIDWATHEEEGTPWEAAHSESARKAANDDDSVWEAVNEDTSVKGTDKGVSGGEAKMANANATEAAETTAEVAETTAAEAAVTTPHHRCVIEARKRADTRGQRKLVRARPGGIRKKGAVARTP